MKKTSSMISKIARAIKPFQPDFGTRRAVCPEIKSTTARKPHRSSSRRGSFRLPFELTEPAPRPPNLLMLGASGHVAQALLQRLEARRADFGRIVLLDQHDGVLRETQCHPGLLGCEFVHRVLRLPAETADYQALLRRHEIHVVVDVTDLDTRPILTATDAAGVSYVNSSLNEAGCGIAELLSALAPPDAPAWRAPHLLSSGMNPGVVNQWVWHGVLHYGTPSEIMHFEYDTSVPAAGWRPIITWSRKEFLTETVWEPTGHVIKGRLRTCPGNALQHRQDLRSLMQPVVALAEYPRGMLVLHEENVSLGAKLQTSSSYLYAIQPRTMAHLEQVMTQRGRVEIDDLELGDNTSVPLTGADTVGVCLDYPDKRVYYLHSLGNHEVTGTNATCAQVAVGLDAALHTLRAEALPPGLHFAHDLYDTVYSDVVFGGLRVEHFVFEKAAGALVRRLHLPHLRPRPVLTQAAGRKRPLAAHA